MIEEPTKKVFIMEEWERGLKYEFYSTSNSETSEWVATYLRQLGYFVIVRKRVRPEGDESFDVLTNPKVLKANPEILNKKEDGMTEELLYVREDSRGHMEYYIPFYLRRNKE